MHYSFKIAHDIIEKFPNLDEYVVASGISPSGSIHIGNYREFITNYYVARALSSLGKRVRMIFSWDDYDRLRKVPKNINIPGFDAHIGKPYTAIPNPFNSEASSYAEHFEREFGASLTTLQMNEIPLKCVYQTKEYKSGRYLADIVHALKHRLEIYDIINSFKTQDHDETERSAYFPISIYCGRCGKDSTTVTSTNSDCTRVTYTCACGHSHEAKLSDLDVKLVWKVDWPMRWKAEHVVFEAAGIDHHSEGGSYQVASEIARKIFGVEPPMSVCYAWVGIKGIGGMHSSSGNAITPDELLKIYEPEMLRWLYAKYDYSASFDFGFDDTIIRHFTEFDRGVAAYHEGRLTEDFEKTVYSLALFSDSHAREKVSFSALATIAPLAEFNTALIKKMFEKTGTPFTKASEERVARVKYWLETYAGDKVFKLRDTFNEEYYKELDQPAKTVLNKLHEFLASERNESEIQQYLYSIINDPTKTKKENITTQQRMFATLYNMLFGRNDGPRLYLYLSVANKDKVRALLAP